MKLFCKVQVSRRLPDGSGTSQTKSSNHVLLVGSKPDQSGVFLQLMTQQNPSGKRYLVYNNLTKVFDKFADEGRATLRFSESSEDILITGAIPTSLKAFLVILKTAMVKGKVYVPLPTGSKQYKPSELKPLLLKLEVKKREDYPFQFPLQLKDLRLLDIRLKRFDPKILQLRNLTWLILSGNLLEELPSDMSSLTSLRSLHLQDNKLVKLADVWPPSLRCLNINNNQLRSLPKSLFRHTYLGILNASHNQIASLPRNDWLFTYSITNLNLRDNCLQTLPTWLSQPVHKMDKLDLSENKFHSLSHLFGYNNISFPFSLKEIAGRAVIQNRMVLQPWDVPREVRSYLEDAGTCFQCMRALWTPYRFCNFTARGTNFLSRHYSFVITSGSLVIELWFCSDQCHRLFINFKMHLYVED